MVWSESLKFFGNKTKAEIKDLFDEVERKMRNGEKRGEKVKSK